MCRIAIKYLYLYLHFKSALSSPPVSTPSGLLARYRWPCATRVYPFFVVDYKSLSLTYAYRSFPRASLVIKIDEISKRENLYLTNETHAIRTRKSPVESCFTASYVCISFDHFVYFNLYITCKHLKLEKYVK